MSTRSREGRFFETGATGTSVARQSYPPALVRSKAILIGTAAVFVTLIGTVLVVATAAPDVTVPPGQPEIVDGHYVLNDHGSLIPVARSVYDRAHVQEEGQFVGLAVLLALGAIANLGATGERILARPRRRAVSGRRAPRGTPGSG